MTDKVKEIVEGFEKAYAQMREELKEVVQECVDNGELDYADAIEIFKGSRLFNISPYIIEEGVLSWYNNGIEEKYRTIYFTEVVDWITDSEGEVTEECDAAGEEDPYKQLYDYAVKHNIIGYEFDW